MQVNQIKSVSPITCKAVQAFDPEGKCAVVNYLKNKVLEYVTSSPLESGNWVSQNMQNDSLQYKFIGNSSKYYKSFWRFDFIKYFEGSHNGSYPEYMWQPRAVCAQDDDTTQKGQLLYYSTHCGVQGLEYKTYSHKSTNYLAHMEDDIIIRCYKHNDSITCHSEDWRYYYTQDTDGFTETICRNPLKENSCQRFSSIEGEVRLLPKYLNILQPQNKSNFEKYTQLEKYALIAVGTASTLFGVYSGYKTFIISKKALRDFQTNDLTSREKIRKIAEVTFWAMGTLVSAGVSYICFTSL